MDVGVVLPMVLYGLNVDGFDIDDNFNSGDDFGNDDWYDFVSLILVINLALVMAVEFFLLLKLAFKI